MQGGWRALIAAGCIVVALGPNVLLSADGKESLRSYYNQAYDLYRQGPAQAPQVIELLQKELQADPGHTKARELLGMTYSGIGEFDKAITEFELVIEGSMKTAKGEPLKVPTGIMFLHVRALISSGQTARAREAMQRHYAFLADARQGEYNLERLQAELLDVERIKLCEIARQVIEFKYGQALHEYCFLVVNTENLQQMQRDGDVGRFLVRDQREGAWATVVTLPGGTTGPYAYGVYFQDATPNAVVRVDYQAFRAGRLTRNGVRQSKENLTGFAERHAPEEHLWEDIEVYTDDGRPAKARLLRKARAPIGSTSQDRSARASRAWTHAEAT